MTERMEKNLCCIITTAVLIAQSLQLKAQLQLASLGWCHTLGDCAKS